MLGQMAKIDSCSFDLPLDAEKSKHGMKIPTIVGGEIIGPGKCHPDQSDIKLKRSKFKKLSTNVHHAAVLLFQAVQQAVQWAPHR